MAAQCGLLAGLLSLVVACGGGGSPSLPSPTPTPTPTILSANLVTPSGAVLNQAANCEARRQMNALMGVSVIACDFTGMLQNTGQGCAANVRGTVAAAADSAACVSVIATLGEVGR